MSFETFFLMLVIGAFSLLAVTLLAVKLWSDRAPQRPPPATVVTPAKRPEPEASDLEKAA